MQNAGLTPWPQNMIEQVVRRRLRVRSVLNVSDTMKNNSLDVYVNDTRHRREIGSKWWARKWVCFDEADLQAQLHLQLPQI